jgi:rhodanese-related sulfurtransferase
MITKAFSARFVCVLVLVPGLLLGACGEKPTPTAVPAATATTAPTKAPAVNTGSNIAQGTLMENEKTPEISTAELQQILASKSATVFDARPFNEFAISHIPGALNVAAKPGVPPSQYVSDVAEIGRLVPGKDAPIVLYCNGPYCGKSKRLSEEMLQAGYTNVRRYQLGIPTWRALVGLTQIELEGVRYVQAGDKTAVFFDARAPEEFKAGTLPGARNLLAADVVKAKDDGRLPIEDHNTRIIVFGKDGEQARTVADAIAKNAFHNVAFYAGSLDTLK